MLKKITPFIEVLIFVVMMGAALVISTPAQSEVPVGSRGFISWYCMTAKQVENVVMASTDHDLNAVLAKSECFLLNIMGTMVKMVSIVMSGKKPHDMFEIHNVTLDGGKSVFVSIKEQGS